MFARLHFSLRQSAWLLALLIITSALPARAQYEEPYRFDLTEDGSGYIMRPRTDVHYDPGVLVVPAVRESDGIPIVGVDGFSYQERLLGIQFYEGSQVKYIGSFEGCTGIEFIRDMPATVEKIGDYAFQGCERLRDVTLNDGLKYIGISCFEGCTSLTSIKLPKSLKVLRENAFRNCATFDNWGNFTGGGLESVVFEDGVDFYNNNGFFCFYNNVFWGCANLSSVTLPKNTPGDFIIPQGTFGYCGNLKSIKFPKNTRRIEQMAFYRSGLESLDLTTIESDVLYLQGYYTFAACENLKTVTAKGKVRFD
ncbi:MAG: leucine-rich repeat domain-containing protein, partial [Muribaculaceae bacterium]|nr:leucine-rich repeat domain-containing protein [Muribaculaceae bacterium]